MCGTFFSFCIHILSNVTLDWISWWRAIGHDVCTFSSPSSWLTQTLSHPHFLSSLPRSYKHTHIHPHTNTKWQRSSDSTLAEMPIITVHLLSIPTQSEVIQKALSELTSCTLESPSSFFCWLQLSVAVWARWRLITLSLSNEPIVHIYAWGGDVPGRCHSKMQCACPWRLNVKCSALYGWMSYTLRNQFMFSIFCSTFQITVIIYVIQSFTFIVFGGKKR